MIEPIKSAYLGADTESPQLASEYLEIKESYRFYVITYSSLIIIRNEILSLYQAVQHLSPPLVGIITIIIITIITVAAYLRQGLYSPLIRGEASATSSINSR